MTIEFKLVELGLKLPERFVSVRSSAVAKSQNEKHIINVL